MNTQLDRGNQHQVRHILASTLFISLLLLAGCGGSSSNSSSSDDGEKNPIEAAPIADDSSISTNEDTPVSGILTASEANGDSLTYAIVENGSRGIAVVTQAATGSFTYTPAPGESGSDSFTFSASNGKKTSNVATVSVTINGRPVATGACNSVQQYNQDPGLVGRLEATDPETPAMLTYSLLNPDGSDAGLQLTTARGGTVSITDATTGAFTYKADPGPGDRRGKDTFDFQVVDPEGATTRATETVVVGQRIMPLGDSITEGSDCIGGTRPDGLCNPDGYAPSNKMVGYRQPLYNSLVDSGYTFDFAGSLQSGSRASPPLDDDDHEGHGGWSAFDIGWGMVMDGSDGVFAWLDQNHADFILLHAGTNDLNNTTANNIEDILDEIDRWEKSANGNPVTVVLARIIDRVPNTQKVDRLNNAVEAMANARTNDSIIVVDQQRGAGINYTIGADMSDWLHPNARGYRKMSNVWFNGIAPLLDKCP